jgi:heme-degrading monooxygenase HmoA
MHAVVIKVELASEADDEAGLKNLRENVAPRVSSAPGFVSGFWLARDERDHGLSVVVFDSEEAARAGAEAARQMLTGGQDTPGVTPGSIDVREVVASA